MPKSRRSGKTGLHYFSRSVAVMVADSFLFKEEKRGACRSGEDAIDGERRQSLCLEIFQKEFDGKICTDCGRYSADKNRPGWVRMDM